MEDIDILQEQDNSKPTIKFQQQLDNNNGNEKYMGKGSDNEQHRVYSVVEEKKRQNKTTKLQRPFPKSSRKKIKKSQAMFLTRKIYDAPRLYVAEEGRSRDRSRKVSEPLWRLKII
jgi:hypothetical protein